MRDGRDRAPLTPELCHPDLRGSISAATSAFGSPHLDKLSHIGGLAIEFGVLRFGFRNVLASSKIERSTAKAHRLDRSLISITPGALMLVPAGCIAGYNLAWTALAGAGLVMVLARRDTREVLKLADWHLLGFFAALFVVVEGLNKTGLPDPAYAHLKLMFVTSEGGRPGICPGFQPRARTFSPTFRFARCRESGSQTPPIPHSCGKCSRSRQLSLATSSFSVRWQTSSSSSRRGPIAKSASAITRELVSRLPF